MEFTGSDWCPPCKKQATEVFAKPEFKEYAAKNLVLLELDFPRTRELAADLKEQNRELNSRFGIRYFPTVVLLDGDEKELTRFVGYGGGGATTLVAKLEAFRK